MQGLDQLLEILIIIFDSSSWGHNNTQGDSLDVETGVPVVIVGILLGWPKSSFGFSVSSYGKIRTNFLANQYCLQPLSFLGTRKGAAKTFPYFILESLPVTWHDYFLPWVNCYSALPVLRWPRQSLP